MKQKPIKGLEKYVNKWVAIDKNQTKVLASGENINEVSKKVIGQDVIFMAVPPLEPYFP